MKVPDSPWIVQKYGGTSLGKFLDTITSSIIPSYLKEVRVVVVCSARSGASKSTGTTKLLLEAISHATDPSTESEGKLDSVISLIRDEHINAAKSVIGSEAVSARSGICQDLEDGIVEDCEKLRNFLHAAQVGDIM